MNKVFATLLSLFLLLGCQRVPRPTLFPEIVEGMQKESFLKDLRVRGDSVHSFRGLARGVLQDGSERAIIRYVILFEKPLKVRIEALPANGAYTLSALVANEGGVTLVDPVAERAYRSKDPSHAIKAALKIPVSPEELTAYLLGEIPTKYLDVSLGMRRSEQGIQLVQGDFSAYWLLDMKSQRLKVVEIRNSPRAAPALRIEYGEYVEAGGYAYPSQLTIDVPRESVRGVISFKKSEFNPDISPSDFYIQIPSGYSVYEGLER